jgi:hypothetical protein
MLLYVGGDNDWFLDERAALCVAARERCTWWRRCIDVEHVARVVQRGVAQSDQTVLATRCRNCVKVGTPCALHFAANM